MIDITSTMITSILSNVDKPANSVDKPANSPVLFLVRYVFHYRVDAGLTYLCMADEESRRRIPFAFLQEIKNRFQATYGDRCVFVRDVRVFCVL